MPTTAADKVVGESLFSILPQREEIIVTLVNGESFDISPLDAQQLLELQYEQEVAFAQAIVASPLDSIERKEVIALAYSTVCSILERLGQVRAAQTTGRMVSGAQSDFVMGLDARYTDLILRLMTQQAQCGIDGAFFEVGFSSGVLLQQIANAGYPVGGLEVVDSLVEQAKGRLHNKHHARLLVGDFRKLDLGEHLGQYSIVYWNDVFEHIPTDEIASYLMVIRTLLKPGGKLVTITPNWHMRPSDVTVEFCPARTEASGFHLKEYTLGEVAGLLRDAGFRSVEVPSFISRRRIHISSALSFTRLKILAEPALEWLPYSWAVQVCRRLGFNCTIATAEPT
ncbi:MAG: class I SAM-dependent methyltransferase [Planctomycetales bacterium]|nr:class I SAM-dependent methyltransferase [Planctomycetales bacterium]